jgi:hypothetical protein
VWSAGEVVWRDHARLEEQAAPPPFFPEREG